ncbi:MAG: hypothetical protein ACP5G0_05575 [Desulfomonilia bacterium]
MKDLVKGSLFLIMAAAMYLLGSCSGPSQYDWVTWYQWRGHCFTKLTVAVESDQPDSTVFVNDELRCSTPCSFELEAAPFVSGQERKLVSPSDGSISYETRNTEFESEHAFDIRVAKDGFKPLEETIVLEDFFESDTLRHKQHYTNKIKMTFHLVSQGQEDFRRVDIEPLE